VSFSSVHRLHKIILYLDNDRDKDEEIRFQAQEIGAKLCSLLVAMTGGEYVAEDAVKDLYTSRELVPYVLPALQEIVRKGLQGKWCHSPC